jgi:hypothetical protein
MGTGASFFSYSPVYAVGSERSPIHVDGAGSEQPWGVFAVLNTEHASSTFVHVHFQRGSEATLNGVLASGMLALHNADAEVRNSVFQDSFGDDALNVKGGLVQVVDNMFVRTYADGVDVDFPHKETQVLNNTFHDIGGDAIDVSWSEIRIVGNKVERCVDKGISIGERSTVYVEGNVIADCDIGIAVKDLSTVTVQGTVFDSNRVAVAVYQKKPIFGGGALTVIDGVLRGNAATSSVDSVSTLLWK